MSCCKRMAQEQTQCCCAKMKCKITVESRDGIPPVNTQNVDIKIYAVSKNIIDVNVDSPFCFYQFEFIHQSNPPPQVNTPLLT